MYLFGIMCIGPIGIDVYRSHRCNLNKQNEKIQCNKLEDSYNRYIVWEDRQAMQIDKYHKICHAGHRRIDFSQEILHCFCNSKDHHIVLDRLNKDIANVLLGAAIQTCAINVKIALFKAFCQSF